MKNTLFISALFLAFANIVYTFTFGGELGTEFFSIGSYRIGANADLISLSMLGLNALAVIGYLIIKEDENKYTP